MPGLLEQIGTAINKPLHDLFPQQPSILEGFRNMFFKASGLDAAPGKPGQTVNNIMDKTLG